jgi:hypothetical protein
VCSCSCLQSRGCEADRPDLHEERTRLRRHKQPSHPLPLRRRDATVPTPVASSGPARALNVQLVTLRPVWARVTVDDKKVIEREIPGGQTIPLGADRSISIRAGDAGAMRLIVDGKDQGTVGRDGQPATRTLTANR